MIGRTTDNEKACVKKYTIFSMYLGNTRHLSSTRDEYLAASPLSISLRSIHGWGGSAVTLEKQAAHRNDCVIIAVIQSGPHTRVESRSGVPDQCWPDWRRMRRWPVGTRWPSSSCSGPRSVRLPRQRVKAFIKVCMCVMHSQIFMCGLHNMNQASY